MIMKLLKIFINFIHFYENTFKVYQQFLRQNEDKQVKTFSKK